VQDSQVPNESVHGYNNLQHKKYSRRTSLAEYFPLSFSSSDFNVLKNDSVQALSQQFPLRLMLWMTQG